jgi:hypothetical protein
MIFGMQKYGFLLDLTIVWIVEIQLVIFPWTPGNAIWTEEKIATS